MNRIIEREDVVKDISLLYELSLSVGNSLDLESNCETFLKMLSLRKNLAFASVWIRGSFLSGDPNDNDFLAVCSTPEHRVSERSIKADHPLFEKLKEDDRCTMTSDDLSAPTVTDRRYPMHGVWAIYRLGDLGLLLLFSALRRDTLFTDLELNKLRNVIRQFSISLEGCLAHLRVVKESEERLKAEKTLAESERRYRALVETANDMIYRTDSKGCCTYANPVTVRTTGRTVAELAGINYLSLVHEDHKEQVKRFYTRQFSERIPSRYLEFPALKKDGTVFWIGQNTQLIFTGDRVVGFQAVARDITQRVKAEQEVIRLKSFYEQILNNLPVDLAVLDFDGKYLYINPHAVEQSDDRAWVVGKSDTDVCARMLLEEGIGGKRIKLLEKARRNRKIETMEETLPGKGGVDRHLIRSVCPVVEDKKGITHFIVYSADVTQLKAVESELRASRQMLQLILNNIPQSVFWKDINSVYRGCNDNFCRAVGLKKREAVAGKTDFDLWPKPDAEQFLAWDRRIMNSKIPERYVYQKDGNGSSDQVWFETHRIPLLDVDERVIGILCTIEDITVRRRSEQALRESEERFRKLAENIPGVVYLRKYDDRHSMLYLNDAVESVTGYRKEEFLENRVSFEELYHPENAASIGADVAEAIGRQQSFYLEYRLRHKSGEWRWVQEIGVGVFHDDELLFLEGFLSDVTDRKKAERDLLESQRFNQRIAETTPDVIYIFDFELGKTIYVNKQVEAVLGYSPEELQAGGIPFIERLIHPDDLNQLMARGDRWLLLSEGQIFETEFRVKHADGTWRWINTRDTLFVRGSDDRIKQIIGTAQDITERKASDEAVRRFTDQRKYLLEVSQAMLSSLAIDEIVSFISEALEKVLKYDVWAIFWQDEESKAFRTSFLDRNRKEPDLFAGWTVPVGMGIVSDVVRTGKAELVNNSHLDPRSVYPQGQKPKQDHLICIPIQGKDRILGAFGVRRLTSKLFTEDELELVQLFIGYVSIAIQNARLFEQMEVSEGNFRSLFEDSKDVVFVSTLDGRFLDINPAGVELFGYDRKEEILSSGSPQEFFWDPDVRSGLIGILKRQGFVKDFESVMRKRNGERIIVLETDTVVRSPDGKITGYRGILRDVTARRESEKALRDKESQLRQIIDLVPHLIFAKDREGRFLLANEAVASYYGTTADKVTGAFQADMHRNKAELESLLNEDREVIESGTPMEIAERSFTDSDGRVRILQTTKIPFTFSGIGEPAVLGVSIDITEAKLAEQQIKSSLKEKEVLLKEIHHRVKNNLQVISSLLNLQSGYVKDKRALDMFRDSQNRVRSMALIHEKMYQSKDLARIDFSAYVNNLVTYLFRVFGVDSDEVSFKVSIRGIFLDIDRAIPCGLIINELVSNSLKHAFPGKASGKNIGIGLARARKKSHYVLTVFDNGVGFPGHLDHKDTKTLGLQLVNTLSEQLNGKLELRRKKDKTEFRVVFN